MRPEDVVDEDGTSTRDQTNRRLVMIVVVVADSRWSSSDGGESHAGLSMLMEVACSGDS